MIPRPASRPLATRARAYGREAFIADLIAGAVTGVLLVPQALAYALLAGLPPKVGLYAALLPALVYALLGSSRALSVGPVAVVSLMTASILGPMAAAGSPEYATLALGLALLAGAMMLLLGLFRLGVLVNFLSYPVLSGFTMGAALLILLSQLPTLFGLRYSASGSAVQQLLRFAREIGQVDLVALAFSAVSVAALLLAQRRLPRWLMAAGLPDGVATGIARAMPLLLVAATSLVVALFHLDGPGGLPIVGKIHQGLPTPGWPAISMATWSTLLAPAALLALVGYLESISIAQVLARKRREPIDANRELVAVGLANLLAGLSQAMPVAGSLTRSVVNDAAGARTRMAGVWTALLVALIVLLLAPLLADLPRTVLAAIIIVAVQRLVDIEAFVRVWRYDRADAGAWIVTAVGVLAAGVETGLVAGLVLSLLQYIWRTANPHVVEVGRVPYTELYLEVDRHHELETWPQLLLLRIDESLFFGNAALVADTVARQLAERPEVTDLILICSAVNAIDASAIEMLEELIDSVEKSGVTTHLANLKGPVMDRLARSQLLDKLGPQRLHVSTEAAIVSLASPPI